MAAPVSSAGGRILVLDIGGSHVKVAFSGSSGEIKVPSGPNLRPREMLRRLAPVLRGKRFDRVSIGYPGVVSRNRIVKDPANLGKGWVGFNFERVFHRPTRIVNDAGMQALGSYRGGRMLFLGLGTGLGVALVMDGVLLPTEFAHLPYKKGKNYEDFVGEAALLRWGRKKWQKEVFGVVQTIVDALQPEYVVLGGGNVRKLKRLPPRCRRGNNLNAVPGGVRLWQDVETLRATRTRLARRPARTIRRKARRRRAV